MNGLTKTIALGDTTFTARELTVLEMRNWIAAIEKRPIDIVGDMLFDNLAVADLAMICNVEPGAFDALTPSQIRQVADACREVNADFFAMLARLADAGTAMARAQASAAGAR